MGVLVCFGMRLVVGAWYGGMAGKRLVGGCVGMVGMRLVVGAWFMVAWLERAWWGVCWFGLV